MQCPLCKNTARLFMAGTLTSSQFFSSQHSYAIAAGKNKARLPIYRCTSCHHGFTPTDSDPVLIENWYAASPTDDTFLTGESARRTTARSVLQRIEKYVPGRGRILDIGSGPGFFVAEAARRGWQAAGLEAAPWAVEYGRATLDVSIERGGLAHVRSMPARTFDVVTLFDVIEHVVDPVQLLQAAAHVLKPHGLLVLTTPKFDSLVARGMGKRWYCIFPAHIHYFTNMSLRQSLSQAGFSLKQQRSHTRYLPLRYFWQRLQGFVAGSPTTRVGKATDSLVIPINFGDEFEVYAQVNAAA